MDGSFIKFVSGLKFEMKFRGLFFAALCLVVLSCKTKISVQKINYQDNTVITQDLSEDQQQNLVIKPYQEQLQSIMNTRISHTNVELNKKTDNPNLGALLADYTFDGAEEWAKENHISSVDAAVINIGGIRSTIAAGDIFLKNIYEIMPFDNEIVIVKLKGSEMKGLFDYYAKYQKNNPVSHLYIETDQGATSKELINGLAVDINRDYYIATSDYLASGGDNMFFFSKGEIINTGIKMRDYFIKKFKDNPEISAPDDVRLIFKNKKVLTDE